MPSSMSNDDSPVYLLKDTVYHVPSPTPRQSLTSLFSLTGLAASVARFDPVTNEKRKLRRSYKNQIADLPGKHEIPSRPQPTDGHPSEPSHILTVGFSRPLPFDFDAVHASSEPHIPPPPLLGPIDTRIMDHAFSFDKTPATGIPNFDVAKLAVDPLETGSKNQGYLNYSGTRTSIGRQNGTGTPGPESSNDDASLMKKAKKRRRRDNSEDALSDSLDGKRSRR